MTISQRFVNETEVLFDDGSDILIRELINEETDSRYIEIKTKQKSETAD